jgi:isoquinoline 1-oxidoreductase beta subunit
MARMTAALDIDGRPVAMRVRLAAPSIMQALFAGNIPGGIDKQAQEGFVEDMPYDVPNYRADYVPYETVVPVGFWRAVSHTQNGFFRECFIDELAAVAGVDPLAYRLRLLDSHSRAVKYRAVLEAAARAAGWSDNPPAGRARGIAVDEVSNTLVAGVAELAVDPAGRLTIHRFVCAIDPGTAVNPMTVEEQVQGGVAFGLSATLYGEITIRDGRIEQGNFHDYRVIGLAEMPRVETVLVPSGGFWGGVGEPPVAVVAPAVCNAVFAATGRRIRALPLKNHDLRRT